MSDFIYNPIESNPIEDGVQTVYYEIRESLSLILQASPLHTKEQESVLVSLDDAISNNWDELMESFWKGVKEG
jgi:hypothetical protein